MKKITTLLVCLFSLGVLAQSEKEIYKMAQDGEAIIVDVREENEIAEGMIKGAKWYPLSKIKKNKEWDQDFKKMAKDKKVFVYCRSGGRAGRVDGMLKEKGISSKNIGGYMTLQNEMPTQQGK